MEKRNNLSRLQMKIKDKKTQTSHCFLREKSHRTITPASPFIFGDRDHLSTPPGKHHPSITFHFRRSRPFVVKRASPCAKSKILFSEDAAKPLNKQQRRLKKKNSDKTTSPHTPRHSPKETSYTNGLLSPLAELSIHHISLGLRPPRIVDFIIRIQ